MATRILVSAAFFLSLISAHAESGQDRMQCGDTDSDPIAMMRSAPVYPHPAQMMCLEGSVTLAYTVAENGRVADIEVLASEPEGIFDRAAIRATRSWLFMPRCIGGQPVADQLTTAIDFELEAGLKAECHGAADRLTDDMLDLVAEIGAMYALLAQLRRNPADQAQADVLSEGLVPRFEGDLGKVERFHHERIAKILDFIQAYRQEWAQPGYLDLIFPLPNRLIEPGEVNMATLEAIEDVTFQRLDRWVDQAVDSAEAFDDLKHATDLDPQTLEMLVESFLGQIPDVNDAGSLMSDSRELIESLFALLKSSIGSWQVVPDGLAFDDDQDSQAFVAIARDLIVNHMKQSQDTRNFLLGFEDYRD